MESYFTGLLNRYLSRPHVTAWRRAHATVVTIAKPEGVLVNVEIPDNVFEWYVSVVDCSTGQELVCDWMDHYGDTDDRLDAEMEEEIARILDAVVDAPVRIISHQKRSWLLWRKTVHVLQSRVGSEWKQIIPFWTGKLDAAPDGDSRRG